MTESKHTPGPWRRQGDTVLIPYRGPLNNAAAFCGTPENAALVEAAPDMLEALEELVAQILDYERVNNLAPSPGRKYCWDATERAVAAIAKATGD